MNFNPGLLSQCLINPQGAKDHGVGYQKARLHGWEAFSVFSFLGGKVHHVAKMKVHPRYISEVVESIKPQRINLLMTTLAGDGVLHEIVRNSSRGFADEQLQIFFELAVSEWTVYNHVLLSSFNGPPT